MNDETKGAIEWLRTLDEDDRDYYDAQRILAHIDGEPARLAAAREELREHTLSLERQVGDLRKMYESAERDAAARYDCKGGPGTTAPACGGCVTCLHRVIEQAEARAEKAERRVAELETFGRKVSAIRDSIVGAQAFNWSEHAYPLVAALGEAGFKGVSYQIARENLGTLIDRASKAEARVAELEADAKLALRIGYDLTPETQTLEEMATDLVRIARQGIERAEKAEAQVAAARAECARLVDRPWSRWAGDAARDVLRAMDEATK